MDAWMDGGNASCAYIGIQRAGRAGRLRNPSSSSSFSLLALLFPSAALDLTPASATDPQSPTSIGSLQQKGATNLPGKLSFRAMDPDSLSKAFVEHYYSQFDSNRQALIALYHEGSMLSFEGEKILGAQNISAKLNSLPFQQCKHNISTVDCQTSGPAGGMLVFVSGNLQLPGEEHLLKFSQMFHLIPSPQGSFYVFNDIFRLNYA